MKPSLLGRVAQVLLVVALPLLPVSVCAQPPAPPDQGPPPVPPQDPPPTDDGPKPAGVGTSQPPKPEEEPAEPVDEVEPLPATSFPGVPLLGTAPSARPFSGLFAGAEPALRRKHSLSLSGSLFAAYSTNVAPPGDELGNVATGPASTLAGGSGSVDYSRNWTTAAVGAHINGARSWIEAYSATQDPWLTRWDVGGDAAFSSAPGRRTRFAARGSVGYSPYLNFGVPDFGMANIGALPIDTPGLDYAVARDPSVLTTGGATLSYALNRKSSLEAYYDVRAQTFVAAVPENFDTLDQLVGGRYRYSFSRYAGLRAGYGHRRASLSRSDAAPLSSHYIDVGLEAGYGRSYALTRRTTFSFSTDSNLFVDESSNVGTEDSFDPQTRLFVGGSADLTHSMGRTWVARTGYRRAVSYEVGFDRPLLSDTALASIGGLINARLDFSANAFYTMGSVGFSGADNGFGTSSATASLRYAITRKLAAYTQYFYYHYSFQRNVALPVYLQSQLDRQGVSVGLTAWLPLIGSRGRR